MASKKTINNLYLQHKGYYVDKYGKNHKGLQWYEPFAGQCVSWSLRVIVETYGYALKAYGNAVSWKDLPKSKRLAKPVNGCLIVYPDLAAPYGHITVYWNGKQIDQNPNKLALRTIYTGRKIYVMPHDYFAATSTRPKPPSGAKQFSITRKYQTKSKMNIRTSPKIASNNVYKITAKGYNFKVDSYIDIAGYRWLVVRYNSKNYYIAEAALTYVRSGGRKKHEKNYLLKDRTYS